MNIFKNKHHIKQASTIICVVCTICYMESESACVVIRFSTYFPKMFLIPLDFFLLSGVVGSVWVLSLFCDLWGSPARSKWSVPCRSVSAMQEKCPWKPIKIRTIRETASSEGNQLDPSKQFHIQGKYTLLHACNRCLWCLKQTGRLLVLLKKNYVFRGTFSKSK